MLRSLTTDKLVPLTLPLYLLNEFNTSLKVKTKINEGPLNAFPFVLFLFKYKHVVIEELL